MRNKVSDLLYRPFGLKYITQIISFGNKVRIIYPKELILKFMKCLDDTKELYRDYR